MKRRKLVLSLTAAAVLIAVSAMATPAPAQASDRTPIPNSAPRWLGKAQRVATANNPVDIRVYLAPNGGLTALTDAVTAASTPGGASYGKFLTPAQYDARFAPRDAEVSSVSDWLASAGLAVTGIEAHHRYISATGSVAAANAAFATTIGTYTRDGQTVQAPDGALSVPRALGDTVLTVTGLDTTAHTTAPAKTAPPPPSFANAHPCSRYYGQIAAKYQADFKTPLPQFKGKTLPYAPCGYTGPQFRAAYEGNTPLDGSGVTVAITDAYAAPTIASDASTYTALHGDGSYANGQLTQNVPPKFTHQTLCDASGWYGEETLDVEAVHAMAPGANIRYYASASCFDSDFLDTLAKVVDENIAKLVTNSWGDTEYNETSDSIAAYEQVFLQGAMQGIGFMFSSGDSGDELINTGIRQTDYPTSDPYVTAVGGTSTAIGPSGALSWETGWGTHKWVLSNNGNSWSQLGFLYGAGGGQSSLFNRPAYQDAVVSGPYRAVPDIALDADPTTGMLIGETQTFPDGTVKYGEYRIGGTSLSSPLFAGMTALALQHGGGVGPGLLNPKIYQQVDKGTFTDVAGKPLDIGNVRVDFANGNDASNGLLYSVRTFNQDSSLVLATGWDDITGIGSPNAGWLLVFKP